MLGLEPRAFHMLVKHVTTELHPQLINFFLYLTNVISI